MLISIISGSCVVWVSFSFSQLPEQMFVVLVSSRGVTLQPLGCQGSHIVPFPTVFTLRVLVSAGLCSGSALQLLGFY